MLKQIDLDNTAIGLSLRPQLSAMVAREAAVISGVEVTLERTVDPLRRDGYLDDLVGDARQFRYVSVHCLELSPASPEAPSAAYLDLVRQRIEEADAPRKVFSDHLGWTRIGGTGLGHFEQPPLTEAALRTIARNVEAIRRAVGPFPFFLENIACFVEFKAPMSEGAFFRRVFDATGAGILLDVTNAYANQLNLGLDAQAFIDEVLAAGPQWQVHLSGGHVDPASGMFIDSHSASIQEPVWRLFKHALAVAPTPPQAVFIERDQEHGSDDALMAELQHIARLVGAANGAAGGNGGGDAAPSSR